MSDDVSQSALPLKILKLAQQMFSGEKTGYSGPEIHEFFKQFSDEIPDYGNPSASRGYIFLHLLSMFPLEKQQEILLAWCDYEIESSRYSLPSEDDKRTLRKWLLEMPITLSSTSALNVVTSVSVRKAWQKSLERVYSDSEGAITSARTLVEAVCRYILDERGVSYKDDRDLPQLYKLVASNLNLSPDQHTEQIFKQILGGCSSVINGLSGLRNAFGDAHGKGKRYVRPVSRHARLTVNSAGTLAEFLIETHEANKSTS